MAQRSVWEVDTVRAQAKFLSITGAMKTVYYVLWRGFAAAEATWEPRSSFDREAIEQDVVPLENALEASTRLGLWETEVRSLAKPPLGTASSWVSARAGEPPRRLPRVSRLTLAGGGYVFTSF